MSTALLDPPVGAIAACSAPFKALPKGCKFRIMLHPSHNDRRMLQPLDGSAAVEVRRRDLVELRMADKMRLLRAAAVRRLRLVEQDWTDEDDAKLIDCIALGLDSFHWRYSLPERSFGDLLRRRDHLQREGRLVHPKPL